MLSLNRFLSSFTVIRVWASEFAWIGLLHSWAQIRFRLCVIRNEFDSKFFVVGSDLRFLGVNPVRFWLCMCEFGSVFFCTESEIDDDLCCWNLFWWFMSDAGNFVDDLMMCSWEKFEKKGRIDLFVRQPNLDLVCVNVCATFFTAIIIGLK